MLTILTFTYLLLTIVMLLSSRVRVGIRFSVWLVDGYAHVFLLLFVVIVTLPAVAAVATRHLVG